MTAVLTRNPDSLMTDARRQLAYGNFRQELKHLLNCQSMENGSNTPDFILADYLKACLAAWDATTIARDKWFKFNSEIA